MGVLKEIRERLFPPLLIFLLGTFSVLSIGQFLTFVLVYLHFNFGSDEELRFLSQKDLCLNSGFDSFGCVTLDMLRNICNIWRLFLQRSVNNGIPSSSRCGAVG